MPARSFIYVPGDRPDRFLKAIDSGADAVIFDLEDAVPLAAKDEARSMVVDALTSSGRSATAAWVRVNTGTRGLEDLRAIGGCTDLTGVFIPKATPASLVEAGDLLEDTLICALIESAAAVLAVAEIAALSQVHQLAMGEVDLAADLSMSPSPDGQEFWPIRLSTVAASAAFGCPPPIGPVWVDVRDTDGLRSSTQSLRRGGFSSRQAIHPAQVAIINDAMSPTADEVDRAARLVDLAERAGGGACVDDDGRMVDEAVLRSARRLLDRGL
jgi:citrate lyase subunit beta / citryl-CoA lyase